MAFLPPLQIITPVLGLGPPGFGFLQPFHKILKPGVVRVEPEAFLAFGQAVLGIVHLEGAIAQQLVGFPIVGVGLKGRLEVGDRLGILVGNVGVQPALEVVLGLSAPNRGGGKAKE